MTDDTIWSVWPSAFFPCICCFFISLYKVQDQTESCVHTYMIGSLVAAQLWFIMHAVCFVWRSSAAHDMFLSDTSNTLSLCCFFACLITHKYTLSPLSSLLPRPPLSSLCTRTAGQDSQRRRVSRGRHVYKVTLL